MSAASSLRGEPGKCTSNWEMYYLCLTEAVHPQDCYIARQDIFDCLHGPDIRQGPLPTEQELVERARKYDDGLIVQISSSGTSPANRV